MTRLSIVAVSYNTKDILAKSLHALLPQVGPDDELIVVDNQSTDGTQEMVKQQFPTAKLLALDKDYGYGYGANRGFEAAQGKYILIMSSDIVFPTPTLNQLVEKMESHPTVGIVCPEFTDFDGKLKQLTWQWRGSIFGEFMNKLFSPGSLSRRSWLRGLLPFLQRRERTVSSISGAAFLIRREAMEKVRGFDQAFQLYYEDADLCERVRQAGYQILFSPSIKVFHELGASMKNELSKTYLMFIQSRIHFFHKHRPALENYLLKKFHIWKFNRLKKYQENESYRRIVDHILEEKGIIPLWQEFQI